MTKRAPCPTCPWRRETKTADIPGGGMQQSSLSYMDQRVTAMGCHQNPDQPAIACSAFMVKVGFDSIGVRLAARGDLDHPDNHCVDGIDVYESFDEMLIAHHRGVT